MSITLRIILIICSVFSILLCIKKIKQSKLKIENSIVWLIGSIILVFMSIFLNVIFWISGKLGFQAPVNFVFFVIIVFLLIQSFLNNMHITEMNEKIKELNHYIALKENEDMCIKKRKGKINE